MSVFGTDSNWGVPVTIGLSFNGTAVDWGTANLLSMAPLDNNAQSVDGDYRISNLDIELIDTNGSIWGSLGHGTTAFNKDLSATVYVGGTMGFNTFGPGSDRRLALQNTGNSATYVVHSGKITDVGRKDRVVRIKSKNNMRLLSEMDWKFPYSDTRTVGTVIGSYYFFTENLGSSFVNSVVDRNEDVTEFKMYAAIATFATTLSEKYPPVSGRGTMGTVSGYTFVGTQFYFDQNIYSVKGTWLQFKFGTINTDEEARRYGFTSMAQAEGSKTSGAGGPNGTYYTIGKSRLSIQNGSVASGSSFHFQQNLTLAETPANLFRELVVGQCVSPYFGTTDFDSETFGTAQLVTGFQSFTYKVDPKGGKVMPAIKNLMESLSAMFSVNTLNKFEFRPYAPKKIRLALESVGTSDILESSVDNSIDDYFNRVILKYGYDPDSSEFKRTYELKAPDWTNPLDRPFEIESKFMTNENEAAVFTSRLLRRFLKTLPKYKVKLPLKYSGAPIGSLYSIADIDLVSGTKVLEVSGYSKDFAEDRSVELNCIDAESLYFRRGYAFWGTKVTLPGDTVDSNSDSGWGTGGTAGTCPGINYDVHGTSSFLWW